MQEFLIASLVSRAPLGSRRWLKQPWPILLGVLFALLLILSACGGAASPTGTTPGAGACGSGLTLVSEVGFGADAATAFQHQTGIPMHVAQYYDLKNRYPDQPSKWVPSSWDVAWFDGQIEAQELDAKGQLLAWDSPSLKNYTALGASLVPTDHTSYPTGLTAAAVIVYNLTHVPAAGLPQDWSDLLKPAYKNLVAQTSPFATTAAYTAVTGIAQVLGGERQGKQYELALKANGAQFFETDTQTLTSVETGARALGIVQDASYYLARQQGQPLGIIYPASGVIALTSSLGIADYSAHPSCAEQFVNWVLSRAGQTVLTHHTATDAATYFIPLMQGVSPVVNRQINGIRFVPYHVVKWTPLALEFRMFFDRNIASIGGGCSCNECCILWK